MNKLVLLPMFLFLLAAAPLDSQYVTVQKEELLLGEPLEISILSQPDFLTINGPSGNYRFMGDASSPVIFVPESPGNYTITARKNNETQELAVSVSEEQFAFEISQGMSNQKVKILDNGTVLLNKNSNLLNNSVAYSVIKKDHPLVDIEIEDTSFRFFAKNISSNNIPEVKKQSVKKIKAQRGLRITDLTIINSSGGMLTKKATGTKLLECVNWPSCEWTVIQDITQGEEYSVQAPVGNTAYAEAGVATINSIKPIYKTGDNAELLVAILDNQGYLVDSKLNVTITEPDGSETLVQKNEWQSESKGIYRIIFQTSTQGTHDIEVSAVGDGIDNIMWSNFSVNNSRPFDIIRSTPISIDPWSGPFRTTLRAVSEIQNPGLLTVTEVLPGNYKVFDDGGARVEYGENIKLSWTAQPGETVSYTANSPLVSPDLYSLRASVTYGTGLSQQEFQEFRPWWMAIDPTDTLTPITSVNTELDGTDLNAGEVSAITTDDASSVTFSKSSILTVDMSSPTNSTPISSVSSFSCTVIYNSEAFSPDATFRVDDSIGGNVLGSTTLAPSTGGDTAITLSNLQNSGNFDITDLTSINVFVQNNDGGKPQSITVDAVSCSVTYEELDVVAPTVTLDEPAPDSFFNRNDLTFNYTPSDNVGFANCSLFVGGGFNTTNSSAIVNGSSNSLNANFGEGTYNYYVACFDLDGNQGQSATQTVTFDTTAPSAFGLSAPPNNTISTDLTPTFSWQATTETNFFNYTLLLDDDPAFGSPNYIRETTNDPANNSYTFTTILAANNVYYWKVIAEDIVGLQTESSQTYLYTTDTIVPGAFDLITPSDVTIDSDTTPFLDWSDSTETNFDNYTIQFDDDPAFGSVNHEYTSTISEYQILGGEALASDTQFNWRVIAYDEAGQSTISTSSFSYTTDNAGPSVTSLAPPDTTTETSTNTIDFNYSTTDALDGVNQCELLINGTSEQTDFTITEATTQTFTQFLANGFYEWQVRCTDPSGNTGLSTLRDITVSVTVDNTAPNILLNFPESDDFLNASTVQFNYTPQDATGILNCSIYIDSSLNDSCASATYNQTISALSPDYRWPLNGDENDVLGSLNSNGGTSPSFVTNIIPNSPYSQAGDYDGSTTVTQIPSATDLNSGVTTQKSISLWFEADTIDATGNGRILWEEGGGTNWLSIYLLDVGGTDYLFGTVGEGGAGGVVDFVNATVTTGSLYHVVLTMDTGTGELILYLDGAQADIDSSLAIGASLASHGSDPAIGGVDGAPRGYDLSSVSGNFDGRIADVVYFAEQTVLTSSEVTDIYEEGAVAACQVNTSSPNYFSVGGFSDAQYSWYVACYDNSTNENFGQSATYNFTVDTIAPTAFNLLTPTNTTITNDNTPTLDWEDTSDTNFDNYTIQFDTSSDFSSPDYEWSSVTSSLTTTTVADANYFWRVIAYDGAGNRRVSTDTFEIIIDATAPKYENLTATPSSPVEYNPGRTHNFTLDVTDLRLDTVTFEHSFSGPFENITPNSSGNTYWVSFQGIETGSYSYKWYMNDSAGNINETNPQSYTIQKNITTTSLFLDGTQTNLTINESTIVNITGDLNWPINGVVTIRRNGTALNSSTSPTTRLQNFSTPGYYEILAQYLGNTNYEQSSDTLYISVLDNIPPQVTLIEPANETTDVDGIVSYGYQVQDTNVVDSCTLYVDGAANGTVNSPAKGTTLFFNRVYDTSQSFLWNVECQDAAGFVTNSTEFNLTVEINEFNLNLNPVICSDSNGCTASNLNTSNAVFEDHGVLQRTPSRNNFVFANISSANIPLGAEILNASILWDKYQDTSEGTFFLSFWNGSTWNDECSSAFTQSSTASTNPLSCDLTNIPSVSEFNNGLNIRANFFYAGNPNGRQFGTDYIEVNVTYREDVTNPSVTLEDPPNGFETGSGFQEFNITASDTNLQNCTLYGDFSGSWSPISTITVSDNLTSNSISSFNSVDLQVGFFVWNAQCVDIASNSAFADQNFTINITPPDLEILSQNIIFESGVREGDTTTVNATVENVGFTTAENFVVEFFRGDPDNGGVQLGIDQPVTSLAYLENITLSESFSASIGNNDIYVRVDGTSLIDESDETNNLANNILRVNAYHRFYGNTSKNTTLDTSDNSSFRAFVQTADSTGSIFFARGGSSISFADLRPLGKNTNNLNTSNDFSEADSLLNMTGFNDSVNKLWANETDRPINVSSFLVAGQTVNEVPVVRSDAGFNFKTGILWDSSDDLASNTEYDSSDAEDLIFVANSENSLQGTFGTQDYEAVVPAKLREYAGGPVEMVEIYVELT